MLQLSNSTYDVLKKIVQVVLPALATLYAGLAQLWNFPNVTGVVGTLTLLATFLGVLLGLSTSQYNKNVSEESSDGSLMVSTVDGEHYLSLGLKGSDVTQVVSKDRVTLDVVRNEAPTSDV